MHILRADTEIIVVVGPVVAVGDGFTPITTLSLSTADEAEIMKHDAAAVTDISGNTFAAITGADGYYNLTLTAAQLDTEGMLVVLINDDSLCLPIRHDYQVVNTQVHGSLWTTTSLDFLQVDVRQISSDTTAADNAEAFFDGTGYAGTGNVIPSVTTVTGNVTGSVGSLAAQAKLDVNAEADTAITDAALATAAALSTAQTDLNTITGSDGVTLATAQALYAPSTVAALAAIDVLIDAIKVQTDKLAFTVANQVDANVQSVNDVTVTGTGALGDEWGP